MVISFTINDHMYSWKKPCQLILAGDSENTPSVQRGISLSLSLPSFHSLQSYQLHQLLRFCLTIPLLSLSLSLSLTWTCCIYRNKWIHRLLSLKFGDPLSLFVSFSFSSFVKHFQSIAFLLGFCKCRFLPYDMKG